MLGSRVRGELWLTVVVVLSGCGADGAANPLSVDSGSSSDSSIAFDGLSDADATATDSLVDAYGTDDVYGACIDTTGCSFPNVPCQIGCYAFADGCWRDIPCADAAWIDETFGHP